MPFPEARLLDIDLTNMKITVKTLPSEIYRLYPGGSALGLYLILKEMEPDVEPFSPDNLFVLTVSPLTGLPISGLSRMTITTKSPLTGAIGDSQAGGFFPAHLKGNGWDGVIIRGKAERPVYLHIDGDSVRLKPAEHLWGKITGEAERLLRGDLGEQIEIAQIGPAGENLVRYACVLNMCNRANGRNGTGAVMGSKNLKAIVVNKTGPVKPVQIDGFNKLSKSVKERLNGNRMMEDFGKYGTSGGLEFFNCMGFLPTRNMNGGWFPEGAGNISGIAMANSILKSRDTCYACAVRCKRVVEISGMVSPVYGGPEYETSAMLGSNCGITKLETIAVSNQLCNMYGLDTISCGATIAFAMECFEKGILSVEDTGGIELRFGNDEAVPKLIEMIAKRQGIGGVLAEGSKRASMIIGNGASDAAMTVKGQEIPAHMPQYKPALGIVYAVNPFGADHQSSGHDTDVVYGGDNERLPQLGIWKGYDSPFIIDDEKVRFAFISQCFYSLMDTLCMCQFVWGFSWQLYGPSDIVELCRYGVGWDTSMYELMLAGERRINMMRSFNAREGFTKKDDRLPSRFFNPLPDGPSKDISIDETEFNAAVKVYYQIAGWDDHTGNPREETLKRLSLSWIPEKNNL